MSIFVFYFVIHGPRRLSNILIVTVCCQNGIVVVRSDSQTFKHFDLKQ